MMNGNQAIVLKDKEPLRSLVQQSIQRSLHNPVQPAPVQRSVKNPLVPTIFHEPWWLDMVTDGQYNMTEVSENGQVVGRLYYFLRRRGGLKYSLLPPMTHFHGPALIEGGGNPSTRFLRRASIIRELVQKLPPAAIYQYKCHREITDVIAFQQEKFDTAVQFTFEVFPDTEEVLWKNLRGEKRKKIRSAQRDLTVGHIQDPMEFWRFYDRNLQAKSVRNRCTRAMCCRIIEECLRRDQGRVYAAYDQHHALAAVVFCVWDSTSSFYFMSSRTADAHHGAISLLAWEAMKDAATRGLIFDFDGLNNSKAVLFFTEFGGIISPRYIVTRQNLLGRVALGLKNMRRENRYFY